MCASHELAAADQLDRLLGELADAHFGPGKSAMIAICRPVAAAAVRNRSMRARCSSKSPWRSSVAQRSCPARIICSSVSGLSQAGPIVATILVLCGRRGIGARGIRDWGLGIGMARRLRFREAAPRGSGSRIGKGMQNECGRRRWVSCSSFILPPSSFLPPVPLSLREMVGVRGSAEGRVDSTPLHSTPPAALLCRILVFRRADPPGAEDRVRPPWFLR